MSAGGSVADLPPFAVQQASASWQAIEFISDLHLSAALPRTFKAFAAHLRSSDADAIYLLGDVFEAWIGDDIRTLPFEARCVEVLADAAQRRTMALMVGNRDFLVGDTLLTDSGLQKLADPTVLEAFGQRVLLMHGDALCLSDLPYQRFRSEVRAPAWQAAFLARPLAERLQIARQLRAASTAAQQGFDNQPDVDVDREAALRWMDAAGCSQLVHGHTHRPGSQPWAADRWRHVLSDWDLDHGDRAEVLRLTRAGFERVPPVSDPASR